jgi:hypothetical protein
VAAVAGGATPFPAAGGKAQQRYERVRSYVLAEPALRPAVSPVHFDLRRLERCGLLGLVDTPPWRRGVGGLEVQIVPLLAADAEDRWARLCELLVGLVAGTEEASDATSRFVCPGLDGAAGEGADDPEPAGRHHALR